MNLLRQLLADIDAVELTNGELVAGYKSDPGDDPGNPVRILPDPLKKHFAVLDAARKSLHDLHERLQTQLFAMGPDHADFEATKKAFQTELDIATSSYKDNERLFWGSVRRTFPDIMDAPEIGLRAGWQVVIVNRKPEVRCEICPHRSDCDHVGMPNLDGLQGLDGMGVTFGPPIVIRGGELGDLLGSLAGETGIRGSSFAEAFAEMIGSGGRRRHS